MTFLSRLNKNYRITASELSESTQDWLKRYIDYDMPTKGPDDEAYEKWRTPTKQVLDELEPYKLQAPTNLYRGLAFNEIEEVIDFLKTNDPIEHQGWREPEEITKVIYDDEYINSWTKDSYTARQFAARFRTGFYIVLEYHAKPEDSLVDVTILPDEMCAKLSRRGDDIREGCTLEEEVILRPGRYECRLHYISADVHYNMELDRKFYAKHREAKKKASAQSFQWKHRADEKLGNPLPDAAESAYTVTKNMILWAIDGGAIGTVEMDPRAFLLLTMSKDKYELQMKSLKRRTQTFDQYDKWGKEGEITIMPFLSYNYKTGKVEGHEGRHRALAAWKEGKKTITVALKPVPKYGKGWDTEFPKQLYGEFSGASVSFEHIARTFKPFDRMGRSYASFLKKVEARNVPIPEEIFKKLSDWAIKQALSFLFTKNKADPKFYKKYGVPKMTEELRDNQVESESFEVRKEDLPVGTLKKDKFDLMVGVANLKARDKGAYAVFLPKHPAIGLYQPWEMHNFGDQEINHYIRDLKASLRHEFIHFIQWATEENIGGKFDNDDPANKDKDYFLTEREYKPQLVSAVRRFEKHLMLLDHYKKKPERKHLLQFVGLKEHTPKWGTNLEDVITDDLFLKLKKHDKVRWKKAIKDFMQMLGSDPKFHYKALLKL